MRLKWIGVLEGGLEEEEDTMNKVNKDRCCRMIRLGSIESRAIMTGLDQGSHLNRSNVAAFDSIEARCSVDVLVFGCWRPAWLILGDLLEHPSRTSHVTLSTQASSSKDIQARIHLKSSFLIYNVKL